MPVICFAPVNNLFEKTISNVQEVQARNGKVLLITDDEGASCLNSSEISMIKLPKFSNFSLCRHDRFDPKMVKIRAILTNFRSFGILTLLGSWYFL